MTPSQSTTVNLSSLTTQVGSYPEFIDDMIEEFSRLDVIPRLWARDHTLCRPGPREIANRLGSLTVATEMRSQVQAVGAIQSPQRTGRPVVQIQVGTQPETSIPAPAMKHSPRRKQSRPTKTAGRRARQLSSQGRA